MTSLVLDEAATIPDIDEALTHLRAVSEDERGPAWTAYLNAVLELRAKKSDTTPHFSQDKSNEQD
jgi:hypothetical protein